MRVRFGLVAVGLVLLAGSALAWDRRTQDAVSLHAALLQHEAGHVGLRAQILSNEVSRIVQLSAELRGMPALGSNRADRTEASQRKCEAAYETHSATFGEMLAALRAYAGALRSYRDETVKKFGEGAGEIVAKLKAVKLPTVSVKPPATIADAADLFHVCSAPVGYKDQQIPFVVKTGPEGAYPVVPLIEAKDISMYDALEIVCRAVGYEFAVKDKCVVLRPKR